MKLIIVESPAKSKTIQKYLGKDFVVTASAGHIMDLPRNDIGIDLDNDFDLRIVPILGKEDIIKKIKDLAKNADEIYLAPDPDREGEAIALHLYGILKKNKGKKIQRITFNSVTKDAVIEALKNPRDVDLKKTDAQKTRRILDRLVGYKISPLLWNKLSSGLSAGRVQSVALRIIVDREEDIKNFIPDKFFLVEAFLKKNDSIINAKFFGKSPFDKFTIKEESDCDEIINFIKGKKFTVSDVKKSVKTINPSPPFTTSKLQQESSTKLGFSAKYTMELAQKLYEGRELGEMGSQGVITYMRTDSVRTDPAYIDKLRSYINNKYGENLLSPNIIIHKGKKEGNVQDAHEAIRPTSLELEPQKIERFLTSDEFKLYTLIWNKFLASQMKDCLIDQTEITFSVEGKYFFKSKGNVIKDLGFKVVYDDKSNKKDDEEDDKLPEVLENESLTQSKDASKKQSQTNPPARYNESSLVKELEDKGIGRPSTYATIISNLTEKKYVDLIDKKFYSTDKGKSIVLILKKCFVNLMDVKFTAKIEEELDKIEDGTQEWLPTIQTFWSELALLIKDANNKIPSLKPSGIPLGIQCPKCEKGELLIKKDMVGCDQCYYNHHAKVTKSGQIELFEKEIKDPCPKCNNELIIKNGKFGRFKACSNYPACKHIEPISTKVTCFVCNHGEFIERQSKNGSIYYSCNNYPKCKTMLWGEPINEKCPFCFNPVLELKENKQGEKYKKCPSCNKNSQDVK